MKINKKNPKHLSALAISFTFSCIGVVARPILRAGRGNDDKIVVFYGHRLNGNLKPFYDYLLNKKGYKPYFLVLEHPYYNRLINEVADPKTILNALSIKDMMTVARSDAFITSHGLHLFSPLRRFTGIKFVDVWHAVSFKGDDADGFAHLRAHDETWVSSESEKERYVNKFKFKPSQVKITGYGRTDQLVDGSLNKLEILKKYNIPKAKKYVLIAPTWKHEDSSRSVLPFELSEKKFFGDLDKIAKNNSAHIIFRTHLNSEDEMDVSGMTNTSFMPYSRYEVVEDFLYIADVMIADWSSISIDFLPLKRPTIFLDVPSPFEKGFNLGPEHRFGDIVDNFDDLKKYLDQYLKKPETFNDRHNKDITRTTKYAYDNNLDGKSVERYFKQLQKLLSE